MTTRANSCAAATTCWFRRTRDLHHETCIRAMRCLLGVTMRLSPIYWIKSLQAPYFGALQIIFKRNSRNIKTRTLSKPLHRFRPNLRTLGHCYYGTLIGTRRCSIDWCYFQRPGVTLTTPNHPSFDILYRLSYCRKIEISNLVGRLSVAIASPWMLRHP